MKLSDFKSVKWLNLVVCLVFCLNFAFSNSALAFAKDASMLRPEATSAGEGKVLLSMVDRLLQEQDKMTIAEAYRADLGRFLTGGIITPGLIEVISDQVKQLLVDEGLIGDYRISYDKGTLYLFITRSNGRAVEDNAKILPAFTNTCLEALMQAQDLGLTEFGEDLRGYTFAKLVKALNIEVAPALKSKELEGWAKLAFAKVPVASATQEAVPAKIAGGKYVYFFGEGVSEGAVAFKTRDEKKTFLGGKGEGLQQMAALGIRVPSGFTITTQAGIHYLKQKGYPAGLEKEIKENLARLEQVTGRKLGDPNDPLLVSVRSGGKVSMPGMMDSVLNLGLNDASVEALAKRTNNPRFAYDSYRRFIEGYGKIVLKVSSEEFAKIFNQVKAEEGIEVSSRTDSDVSAVALKDKLIPRYKALIKESKVELPSDPLVQLNSAVMAVFDSWNSQRAIDYRRLNKIPDDAGTACNIVEMVFGNISENSGTGVYFTRNPDIGTNVAFGDYLRNAQGEDVVSGKYHPVKIGDLEKIDPDAYKQLLGIGQKLENYYNDMQDIEFTIEEGTLYILQCRTGKRTGPAAAKIAVDMVSEGRLSKEDALQRVTANDILQIVSDQVDPEAAKGAKIFTKKGPAGTVGASVGKIVFDTEGVLALQAKGEKAVLARVETSPEDINGMMNASAIITAKGGDTSHAAIVCKSAFKVGIFGAEEMIVDYETKTIRVGDMVLREGDVVTVDATNKVIYIGELKLITGGLTPEARTLLGWADNIKRLGVRANADTPAQATKAREFGAEGIGLLRIEHWIQVKPELQKLFQLWIISDDANVKKDTLSQLEPLMKKDMKEILRIMQGYPVIVRTLDPPLHEFLPRKPELIAALAKELGISEGKIKEKIESLKEANPMLGHRGVRLGITDPEITEMQVRAIISAGCELVKEGIKAIPEIMIPVVAFPEELKNQKDIVRRVAKEVMDSYGVTEKELPWKFGTMIELPSAALSADELAEDADFFSFGTNDLTQTTTGLSRDDAKKFLTMYILRKIIGVDPFVTLHPKVAKLMSMTIQDGRRVKKDLEIGICGEHGRDPESIKMCDILGLDYVSPSGAGVPVARLVAAQAQLEAKAKAAEAKAKTAVPAEVKPGDLFVAKINPTRTTALNNPTVRLDVELSGGAKGYFVVPAGTSSGEDEAKTVGVDNALRNLQSIHELIMDMGVRADRLSEIAHIMLDKGKDSIGAEATLSYQMATAWAVADQMGLEHYQYIRKIAPDLASFGVPRTKIQYNITNGGQHAKNSLDMQEFMVVASGKTTAESNKMCDEIDRQLGMIYQRLGLKADPNDKGVGALRGKEGGYKVEDLTLGKLVEIYANVDKYQGNNLNIQALKQQNVGIHEFVWNCLLAAIKNAGYTPSTSGKPGTVALALDAAASSMLVDGEKDLYKFEGHQVTSADLIRIYAEWVKKYPIDSIEDGLGENDWDGWLELFGGEIGNKALIIGDDLLVTQGGRLLKLIQMLKDKGLIDANGKVTKKIGILIKLNQNGFLTTGINDFSKGYLGTLEVIRLAKSVGMEWVVSHRSNEAGPEEKEVSIADLAAGTNAYALKSGDHVQAVRAVKEDRLAAIDAMERQKAEAKAKGVVPAAVPAISVPTTPLIIPPTILNTLRLAQWTKTTQTRGYYESLLALQSSGVTMKLGKEVFETASDKWNEKIILISLKVLLSDPSLLLALQNINLQINQHLGKLGNDAAIIENAYRFILVDDVGLGSIEKVEELLAQISKITNGGIKANSNMFDDILTQKGAFSPEALIKDNHLVVIAGLIGDKEWVDALAQVDGVSKDVIRAYVGAKAGEIAFAANALFGTVELVAKKDATLPQRLELIKEATSITVKATAINAKVEDEIEAYRRQVEVAVRV